MDHIDGHSANSENGSLWKPQEVKIHDLENKLKLRNTNVTGASCGYRDVAMGFLKKRIMKFQELGYLFLSCNALQHEGLLGKANQAITHPAICGGCNFWNEVITHMALIYGTRIYFTQITENCLVYKRFFKQKNPAPALWQNQFKLFGNP